MVQESATCLVAVSAMVGAGLQEPLIGTIKVFWFTMANRFFPGGRETVAGSVLVVGDSAS